MPSLPLPELHVTEMLDGHPPVKHVVQISELDESGVTIGRAGNIRICQHAPKVVAGNVSRRQATIYATPNPVRPRPDVWLRAGAKDQAGKWKVSGRGTGVWLTDHPINTEAPVQLRPGALLKIVPKVAGYQCLLEWDTYTNGAPSQQGHPTSPMGTQERDRLYFENRTLKEQAAVKDVQIETLESLSKRHWTLAEELRFQTKQLGTQIKKARDITRAQDKKIGKIKMLGALAVVALLISLGVVIEQLDNILQFVAALSGAGLIWTAVEKPSPEE